MKSSARNIQLTSFEELLGGDPPSKQYSEDGVHEKVQDIPLMLLHPFTNHPFKVLDDEEMMKMAETVKEHGVLTPGIARKRKEGGFELIAGHRRKRASELAGCDTLPVIVREMDDDEAVIYMVNSNLQRETVLPSEKAWAYKMKLDAIRRKAGRPKSNSSQVGEKYSVNVVSEESEDSARNIHRFICLTRLMPLLLQMVDDKKLAFNTAVELSYLIEAEQEQIFGLMQRQMIAPSLEQAKTLKKYSQEGKLDGNVMEVILLERKPGFGQVTIKSNRLKQYFPSDYTKEQMEGVIFQLLEKWKAQQI